MKYIIIRRFLQCLFVVEMLLLHGFVDVNGECPKKLHSVSGDYNVMDRFNKIVAANPTLEVDHVHEEGNRQKESYTYHIKFCGEHGKPSVTQAGSDENKEVEVVGTLNENSTIVGGENWIFLQYLDGAIYKHHCHHQKRKAWIYIRCEDKGEKPQLHVVEESRYDHKKDKGFKHCFYLFEYNHPMACNTKIQRNPKKDISGGSIFLIVLISLFGAYFLFGFLYLRFVMQKKGFEQIPNFPFWKKIGNMSADGCDFFCRRDEGSNTYKGMADALDIDSSDEEDKDDGLLPM